MNARRTLKFRGDQERRRFIVGVAVDAACRTVTAGLVAASGRGLEARFEVASHVVEEVPATIADAFARLSTEASSHPTDGVVLAAQLAEVEAAAINQLAAIESDVWGRVLLVGVTDPGLWNRSVHPPDYLSLCDSARLADLTGLNVVDAFPARDIVQEGRGGPLDALPQWLLLHHSQTNRLLVQLRPSPTIVFLPGSRDETGIDHIEVHAFEDAASLSSWLGESLQLTRESVAPETTFENAASSSVESLAVDELLLLDEDAKSAIPQPTSQLRIVDAANVGIPSEALNASCAALLGMLHIDQAPANLPFLTGATAPRVLGCLTPGSAYAWNRLLRDLAFARPLVTPLRAAV